MRFQKGKSTQQAIEMALEKVNKFESKWCAMLRIDATNPFNTASHNQIVEELKYRRKITYLVHLVVSYFSNQQIQLDD